MEKIQEQSLTWGSHFGVVQIMLYEKLSLRPGLGFARKGSKEKKWC